MSTDHQKYSTENQSDAIKQYAQARGIEIVKTYADAGKSGLKIEGRDALQQLIEDVKSGIADFTLVLVYDCQTAFKTDPRSASNIDPSRLCSRTGGEARSGQLAQRVAA